MKTAPKARSTKRAVVKRRTKLKLPTLVAFKKLPLIERTKWFARWAKTKRRRYEFMEPTDCPLAQFGAAISSTTRSGGVNDIDFAGGRVPVFPWAWNVLIDRPATFPALAERLAAHIAEQA